MKSDKEILEKLAETAREITECRKKLFAVWQTIIDLGGDFPRETESEKRNAPEKKQQERKRARKLEWAVAFREVPFKNNRQAGTPGGWDFCECFAKGIQEAFATRKEARNYMRDLNFCRDMMIAAQELSTGKPWSGTYSQHKIVCHPAGSWEPWSFAK